MDRQIAIDFGTTTSALGYWDHETDSDGIVTLITTGKSGKNFCPTVILQAGTITNKRGEQIPCQEAYGWDAAGAADYHALLKRNFKMDLVSSNPVVRQEAQQLTEMFFRYLFAQYTNKAINPKGGQFKKVSTIVTYPAKFPEQARQILKNAAEKAGFQNVTLLEEAKAAMQFVLDNETSELKTFFQNSLGKKLKVMLIDMGAGTTDIAIFEYDTLDTSKFTLLCSWPEKGGTNFGGCEIDKYLCDFYQSRLDKGAIVNTLADGNSALAQVLLENSVKTFKEKEVSVKLAEQKTIDQPPTLLIPVKYQMAQIPDTQMDRAVFEELLKDYLPQFPELVKGALQKATLSAGDVDLVLLTGGHSQWYFVEDMLGKLGIKKDAILTFADPHLVVARGAIKHTEPEQLNAVPVTLTTAFKQEPALLYISEPAVDGHVSAQVKVLDRNFAFTIGNYDRCYHTKNTLLLVGNSRSLRDFKYTISFKDDDTYNDWFHKLFLLFSEQPSPLLNNDYSINFDSLNSTIHQWEKRLSRTGHYEPITVVTEDTKYADAVKYKEDATKYNALLDMGTLKSNNATVRILPLHGGPDILTLSNLDYPSCGCEDYATTVGLSSNGKRYYLIHTDKDFTTQLFATVQELWKKTKFVPPTPVPKKYIRKVDTSKACPSDCFIQLSGRCNEKGHVCTCDEVCVDSDCNRNCRSNCRCNGKCSDYTCSYGMSQYH